MTGKSILFIEDDADILDFCSTMLVMDGYEVVKAGTLEDGLDELSRRHFDIIFSDLSLPGACGMDVFDAVFKFAGGTPIVVISGVLENGSEYIRRGAADYEQKPFDRTLSEIVKNVLDVQR